MRINWFARVLMANALLNVAMNGIRPVISYRAIALDAGPAQLGVIAASFGLLSLTIAIPAGRRVDRAGETKFIVGGALLTALAALLLVRSYDLATLALSTMLLGAGQIIYSVAIQTLIANGGPPEGRDRRFATQTVIASLGQMIGPAVAGIILDGSTQRAAYPEIGTVSIEATNGVFLAAMLSALIAAVVAMSLSFWPPSEHVRHTHLFSEEDGRETIRRSVGRVLRTPSMPQAMLCSLAALSSVDILVAYLPVYGDYYGIPATTIGLLLAVRGGASITSRLLMLPLYRLLGRRRLLIMSMVIAAVSVVALPFGASNAVVLFGAMGLIGFGLGLCQPLTMSWVASRAPVEIRGTAVGIRLSANRLGQFALPVVMGAVAGTASVPAIFWALAALLGLSAALVSRGSFE